VSLLAEPEVTAPSGPARWRQDAVVGFFTLTLTVLLGPPAGLLWSALAPHAHVSIGASGVPIVDDGGTEVFVAADGWFLAVCLVAGLLTGIVGWLAGRRSGPVTVAALTVGGLLAALVAAKVGMRLGQDQLRTAAQAGTLGRYGANVALQAKVIILVWPIAGLGAFLALMLSRVEEID
jgi:biotin transporter BioY